MVGITGQSLLRFQVVRSLRGSVRIFPYRIMEELLVTPAIFVSIARRSAGLTRAHGLIATTPEPNAENRGAVCS